MSTSSQVIAILDEKKIVVGFTHFNDEGQFDRMFKECQKKNQNVRIMNRDLARQHMVDEKPVE